jgi:hypothetical protein
MKKLSEQFLEMGQRTARLEGEIAAFREEDRKAYEATVAEVQSAAQSAQAAFAASLNKVEGSVNTRWHGLKDSFDKHVANARQKVAEGQVALDLADARAYAEDAEADAEIAAEFARLTATTAEEAMLEAKRARANAQSLEQAVK